MLGGHSNIHGRAR